MAELIGYLDRARTFVAAHQQQTPAAEGTATPRHPHEENEGNEEKAPSVVSSVATEWVAGRCTPHRRLLTYAESLTGACSWCHPERFFRLRGRDRGHERD